MILFNKKLIEGKKVKTLSDIKKNSKVAIMPPNAFGIKLYRLISKYRKDVKVTCFLEGNVKTKSKKILNIEVKSIFQKDISDTDIILFLPLDAFTEITRQIKSKLILKKIKKCFIGDLNFFNRKEVKFNKKNKDKVISILKDQYSKNLFKKYINIEKKKSYYDFTKLLIKKKTRKKNIYFDHNFFKTKKKIVVFEGGSNIFEATYKILRSRKKNSTSIVTFDPIFKFKKRYKNYTKKYYNKIVNKYGKNFEHQNLALSNNNKINYFNFEKKHRDCFLTSKKIKNAKCKKIQCMTIDEFCKKNRINKVDYLKLDCENSERKILLGGKNILHQNKTNIVAAVYHSKNDVISIIKLMHKISPENKIYLKCYWYNGISLTAYSKNNIN